MIQHDVLVVQVEFSDKRKQTQMHIILLEDNRLTIGELSIGLARKQGGYPSLCVRVPATNIHELNAFECVVNKPKYSKIDLVLQALRTKLSSIFRK